jgi:hypothetical protein
MATRSTIALEKKDGTVVQVYCHWDGYIGNNGVILQENYQNYDNILKLVNGGPMSCLDETVDGCTFYNDDDSSPNYFVDLNDFYENFQSEEYNYLWTNNQWWVNISNSKEWHDLAEQIKNETV